MMIPFVVLGDRIRVKLQHARIPESYELCVSSLLLYSIVAGIVRRFSGLIISFVVIEVIRLLGKIAKLT